MNICIQNKELITGNIRNRGNKELSRQSNCSVLQSTKVGSAKEYDQYILIPQRVSQQSVHSYPSKIIKSQGSWVSSSRYQHSPTAIHIFLTSIPGSLGLKIVPRRYINIQRNHFPPSSKPPQESPIQFPQESWNPSPKQ